MIPPHQIDALNPSGSRGTRAGLLASQCLQRISRMFQEGWTKRYAGMKTFYIWFFFIFRTSFGVVIFILRNQIDIQ